LPLVNCQGRWQWVIHNPQLLFPSAPTFHPDRSWQGEAATYFDVGMRIPHKREGPRTNTVRGSRQKSAGRKDRVSGPTERPLNSNPSTGSGQAWNPLIKSPAMISQNAQNRAVLGGSSAIDCHRLSSISIKSLHFHYTHSGRAPPRVGRHKRPTRGTNESELLAHYFMKIIFLDSMKSPALIRQKYTPLERPDPSNVTW
jgi:hypothetical protein